jgi:flavin-dependent dehydrogenase
VSAYDVDLLIVGAGPVGLAASIWAAKSGMTVAVTDPRPGPRDKACGEGLMPGAVRLLSELGCHPTGYSLQGITYLTADASASATARFHKGMGLGVRRTTLSSALEDLAGEAGVKIFNRRVTEVHQESDHVSAAGIRARWMLAADGLHSPVRRLLGLEEQHSVKRYGFRSHFPVAPWSETVEVYWSDDSEAYITPTDDHNIGVAILGPAGGSFEDRIEAFPALVERLRRVEGTKTMAAGPFRHGNLKRVDGRVLFVGDASGYVDALTGEGIAVGLAQAKVAVESLIADRPGNYESQWRKVSRRSRGLTRALLFASSQDFIRGRLVRTAERHHRIFDRTVRLLS